MSKRRPQSSSSLDALFEAADQAEEVTRAVMTGGEGLLSIRQVRPDPFQARRVLPPAVRIGFVSGQLDPPGALAAWQALADDDPREAELLRTLVINLATSIREQELVNPITVCADGQGNYVLETGERRWWAHWWLVSMENEATFEQVRAQVVPAASPARQAAENLQDSPLTAVQEACQIARLLLHLTGRDTDHVVAILAGEREEGDDSYGSALLGYAPYRVALNLQRREVYGKWPEITRIMGRGDRQLQRRLAILELADDALTLADRAGLTEGQLRTLVEAADRTDGERQRRIVSLVAKYDLPGSELARLVETQNLDRAEARLERRRKKQGQGEDDAPPAAIRRPSLIMLERLQQLRRLVARHEKGGLNIGDLVDEIVASDRSDAIYHDLGELTEMLLLLREELANRSRESL